MALTLPAYWPRAGKWVQPVMAARENNIIRDFGRRTEGDEHEAEIHILERKYHMSTVPMPASGKNS